MNPRIRPPLSFACSRAIFRNTSSETHSTNPAPNKEGVINESRTFWVFDKSFTSGVAPPTAFVVISVPPGAGMNSLFVPRCPARSSVIGPLPPGKLRSEPRPARPATWQPAQEVSLKWMPRPFAGVSISVNASSASWNCFGGSKPFWYWKLCGTSWDHPFTPLHMSAIASKADFKTLLIILPPDQKLQSRKSCTRKTKMNQRPCSIRKPHEGAVRHEVRLYDLPQWKGSTRRSLERSSKY